MNIDYLYEGLELISTGGVKLTPEQTIFVENSLIILQNENKFRDIFFWGRIDGIDNDYFIAFGYTCDCLTERKYFYSLNCNEWILLPPPKPELYEACYYCTEMFLGDPTNICCVKLDPQFCIDEKQIVTATESGVCKFKEEERLSTTVYLITEESALIPRGGLYKLIDSSIAFNSEFRGLNDLQANDLTCYQLYRKPRNRFNYNLLKRNDYNYCIDFLDTIDDIIPENIAFSLNLQKNESLVLIRSLIWNGMNFFHKLYSRKHGFVYFGNGKRNFDLLFMI